MDRLCRILVSAMLVVHLTVGCCALHAHACQSRYAASTSYCDASLQERCVECRCDHSHPGLRLCSSRKCFLASLRRPVDDTYYPPFAPSSAALCRVHSVQLASGLQRQFRAASRHLLPVRFHIAKQVFLI